MRNSSDSEPRGCGRWKRRANEFSRVLVGQSLGESLATPLKKGQQFHLKSQNLSSIVSPFPISGTGNDQGVWCHVNIYFVSLHSNLRLQSATDSLSAEPRPEVKLTPK